MKCLIIYTFVNVYIYSCSSRGAQKGNGGGRRKKLEKKENVSQHKPVEAPAFHAATSRQHENEKKHGILSTLSFAKDYSKLA